MGSNFVSCSSDARSRDGRWDALEKELLPLASRIASHPDELHRGLMTFGKGAQVEVVCSPLRMRPTWAQRLFKRVVCSLSGNRYEGRVRVAHSIRVIMPKEAARSWQQRLANRLWDFFKVSKRRAIGCRLFESREAAIERRLREKIGDSRRGKDRCFVGVPGVV
ncbi:hypothetical protein [Paracidovorax citrulli]